MTSRIDLEALAARVEAAEAADSALAKDIFRAVFPERVPELGHPNGYGWREDESGWWLATGEDARTPPKTIYPPKWLTSIDAALQLVPEGCGFDLSTNYAEPMAIIWLDDEPSNCPSVHAATPALALCAAALRARAST